VAGSLGVPGADAVGLGGTPTLVQGSGSPAPHPSSYRGNGSTGEEEN